MSVIYNKRNWYSENPYYLNGNIQTDGTYLYFNSLEKLFKLEIADFTTIISNTDYDDIRSLFYKSDNLFIAVQNTDNGIREYVKKIATSDLSEVASYQKAGYALNIIGVDVSYVYVKYYKWDAPHTYYGIEKLQLSDLTKVDSYDVDITTSYPGFSSIGDVDSSFVYWYGTTALDERSVLKIDKSDMTLVETYVYSGEVIKGMYSTGTYLFVISDSKLRKVIIDGMTEDSNIDIVSGIRVYYDGTSIWTLTNDYSTLNTVQRRKVVDMSQETSQIDDDESDFPLSITYLNNHYFVMYLYNYGKVSELSFQKKKFIMGYF